MNYIACPHFLWISSMIWESSTIKEMLHANVGIFNKKMTHSIGFTAYPMSYARLNIIWSKFLHLHNSSTLLNSRHANFTSEKNITCSKIEGEIPARRLYFSWKNIHHHLGLGFRSRDSDKDLVVHVAEISRSAMAIF